MSKLAEDRYTTQIFGEWYTSKKSNMAAKSKMAVKNHKNLKSVSYKLYKSISFWIDILWYFMEVFSFILNTIFWIFPQFSSTQVGQHIEKK